MIVATLRTTVLFAHAWLILLAPEGRAQRPHAFIAADDSRSKVSCDVDLPILKPNAAC